MHWVAAGQTYVMARYSAPRDMGKGLELKIHCGLDLEWRSADHVGRILTKAGNLRYSATGRADGGDEPSPEVLLIAAISSCYSIALSDVLQAAFLPQSQISVHTDGVLVRDRGRLQFACVTVNPTICGADTLRREAYQKAAIA